MLGPAMPKSWLFLAPVTLLVVLAAGEATAADEKVALGELTPAYGVAYDALQSAAVAEIGALDTSHLKRKVIVSIAVVKNEGTGVAVSISALVRDKKTGNMLAVVSGRAQSEKDTIATRTNVLRAAVRCALSQVPQAAR